MLEEFPVAPLRDRDDAILIAAAMKRPRFLAYAIPASLGALAVQTWFSGGAVIAGGDVSPPLLPGRSYLSHWNQFTVGEGSPSYDIAALPYYEALRFFEAAGFDESVFQRSWLTVLVVASACAITYFAYALFPSALVAGSAGCIGIFNAYRLTVPVDHVSLATTVCAALLGGMILRAGLFDRAPRPAVFAIASLVAPLTFLNPAYLMLALAWLVICCATVLLVGGLPCALRLSKFLVRAIPLSLAINLWWVVPVLLTILGPTFGDRFAAAEVEQWSWTHARASITNVLTLNTSWAWPSPQYFPYAHSLERPLISAFRYGPIFLAIVGVALARDRWRARAVTLAALGLCLVLLAKGLHPPLADANRWAYRKLPGLWLFRDPAKVVGLVALVIAVLAGLGVGELVAPQRRHTWRLRAFAIGSLACALFYVYPLFDGSVVARGAPVLGPADVRVPVAWRRSADVLNGMPAEGKALVLPGTFAYQIPTSWRYWGPSFAKLLIRRPVIEGRPGAYFRSPPEGLRLAASVEQDLLDGGATDIRARLRALGVKYIVVRRDFSRRLPTRLSAHPDALERGLENVPGVARLGAFTGVDLYTVDGPPSEVRAYVPRAYAGPADWIPSLVEANPVSALVSVPRDRLLTDNGFVPAYAMQSGSWTISTRFEREKLRVRLTTGRRAGRLVRMNIALAAARANPESTPRLLLTVGKAVFRVPRVPGWHQLGIVFVTGPTFARLWERGGVSPIGFDEGGPVSDCRRFDERSLSELGISALIRKPDARFLQLRARAHSACISYPVEAFDPDAPYSFSIEYRTVRGPTPRICVWQVGPNRCVETRPLQRSSQWKRFAITLTPEPGTVGLQFFVYADGESTTSTVTEFQSLAVGRSRLISRRRINPAAIVQIGNASEANPIPRERLAQLPIAISDASSVIDCRRIDDRSISDVGISAVVTRRLGGPILRLRARAHSACASVAVPTATTGTYALSFDYRRRTGSRPRLCVWQVGPDECLDLPPLADEDKWRSFQARIKLDPATSGVFLFFYADGPDAAGKRTTTEYRNLALARVIETGLIAEQSRGAPLPRLRYRKESPHEFRVKVSGAREPFLLTLTETYASGWSLKRRGIRSGQGKHVRVNGYANGWIVPWRGDYELVLTYSPERVAATAWFVSALALAILVISIVRRELPRLRRADELTAP